MGLVVQLFMLGVFGFAVGVASLQVWLLRKWKGGWRVAAAVPGAILCAGVAWMIMEMAFEPTSHNMWPFEVIGWTGLNLIALGLLALARFVTQRMKIEA